MTSLVPFLLMRKSPLSILPVSHGALSMLFTWVRAAIHKLCWLSVNRSKPPLLLMSRKREREGLCSKSYPNRSELIWQVMSCDITDTAKLDPGRFSNAKVQNPHAGRSKIE
uniref:Putative secreted protein n=1 Tax=Ixodes scapularis TaxID=6945 RepID=A0A4D5RFQ5_IXOSC